MVKKWISAATLIMAIGSALSTFALDMSWTKNWFVDADFLAFEASEDGLEYVRYNAFSLDGLRSKVNSREPNFRWDGGFRVGLGYRGECDNWFSALTWTHFNTHAKDNVDAPLTPLGYQLNTRSLFVVPFVLPVASFIADAQWKLDYNVVDLDVGVPYCLNSSFVARPFFGFRSATIDQRFSNNVTSLATGVFTNRFERAKHEYRGFGMHAGFDLVWNFWRDFGIYGKAGGSLVYGRFKITDRIESNIGDAPFLTTLFSTRHNSLRSNLEGAIGIQVVTGICNNSQKLTIRLGYELIQWFDQNQFPGPLTPQVSRSSSLGLQGLQVSGRYDF
jgi:hypothetical protein